MLLQVRKELDKYLESKDPDIVEAAKNQLAKIGKIKEEKEKATLTAAKAAKKEAAKKLKARAIKVGLDPSSTEQQVAAAETKLTAEKTAAEAAKKEVEDWNPTDAEQKTVILRSGKEAAWWGNMSGDDKYIMENTYGDNIGELTKAEFYAAFKKKVKQ